MFTYWPRVFTTKYVHNYIYMIRIFNDTWIIPFFKFFIIIFKIKKRIFIRFYRAPELLLGSTEYDSQVLFLLLSHKKFELFF